MADNHYVYEHWRPDTGMCFYVGKGCANRAYRLDGRNPYHKRIVAKLQSQNLTMEVRFISTGLTEEEAFYIEQGRIAHWRALGVNLSNMTDGGEGRRGYRLSDETKEKIRQAHLGRKVSEEARRRMSEAHKGHAVSEKTRLAVIAAHTGKKRSAEWCAAISRGQMGKKNSPEARAKISAAQKGKKRGPRSLETRQKLSAAHKGRKFTPEHRAKMRAAWVIRRERERAQGMYKQPVLH